MHTPAPCILIVDDHALFRSGMRMILHDAFAQAQVFESDGVEHALAQTPQRPDVVLLDIRLQGLNGIESIALLQRRWPQVPVIMLSSDASSHTVEQALARGARAFVSKADDSATILQAIRAQWRSEPAAEPASPERRLVSSAKLTPRQCEVLHYLSQGLANKVIARKLDVSENTVRGHVQLIMSTLECSSRTEAVFKARQLGLLH